MFTPLFPAAPRRALPLTAALLLAALACLLAGCPAQASPTSITYTGQLLSSTAPPAAVPTGSYDMQFQLFTAATGGSQVGSTVSLTSVPVVNGVYYAQLYFGLAFTGTTYWIQVNYRVHPASGNPAYTAVPAPRPLAPNEPFSNYALVSATTQGLQGKGVSTTAPTTGQVLTYNGTLWAPGLVASSGLALPLSLTSGSSSPILAVRNNGSGYGLDVISSASIGVRGTSTGSLGVLGQSDTQTGVAGASTSGSGVSGQSTSGAGVVGDSQSGDGGYFTTAATGANVYSVHADGGQTAVYGKSEVSGGVGVSGLANGAGASGVSGTSDSGAGVTGTSSTGNGGTFTAGGTNGVSAESTVNDGNGVQGIANTGNSAYGVYGISSPGYGVVGFSGSGTGVYGDSSSGVGVYGDSNSGSAGYFRGNVTVTGSLSKAGGSFKIDHPLDPAHKYLSHSFVESPDMMNVYNGIVTTDAHGDAAVQMPDWFEALNQDFRYQLTVIGQFSQAIVASEMAGNRFAIKTDRPNVKVSWQVTGIRHDAWANAHRIPVEEDKPEGEQGTYLHPKERGLPEALGVGYAERQAHGKQR